MSPQFWEKLIFMGVFFVLMGITLDRIVSRPLDVRLLGNISSTVKSQNLTDRDVEDLQSKRAAQVDDYNKNHPETPLPVITKLD